MRRFGGHEDVEPVRARFRAYSTSAATSSTKGSSTFPTFGNATAPSAATDPPFSIMEARSAAFLEALEGARRVERLAPVVAERPRVVAAARAGHLDAAAVAGERPPEGRAQRREAVLVRRELRGALEARAALRRRGDEEREAPRRLYEARRREPRGLGRLRRAEGRGPSSQRV